MQVRFWGVRGSTPTPHPDQLQFGGNTACIEVRSTGGQAIILDGGTGVRQLGQRMASEAAGGTLAIHLFLTHYHWDHIQGIPFFVPLYHPGNEMNFYAHAALGSVREHLEGQMSKPYFPVSLNTGARCNFIDLDGPSIQVGDLTVEPFPMNHPQGAYGYRVSDGRRTLVYASDLEHGDARHDRVLREYATGADLLVYDSQYTPEEYPKHRGWGHSNWLEGTRVAREAGARCLVLFHHEPWHNDQVLLEIGRQARLKFENTVVAEEGTATDLADGRWHPEPRTAIA